jgi:hypothetical protein
MTINGVKVDNPPALGQTVTASNGDTVVYTVVNEASVTPVPPAPPEAQNSTIRLVKTAPAQTDVRPAAAIIDYVCTFTQGDGFTPPSTGSLSLASGSLSSHLDLGHAKTVTCTFTEPQTGLADGYQSSYHVDMTINGVKVDNPPALGSPVTAQNGDTVVYTIVNGASTPAVPPAPEPPAPTPTPPVVEPPVPSPGLPESGADGPSGILSLVVMAAGIAAFGFASKRPLRRRIS